MLHPVADLIIPGDEAWNVRDAVVGTCSRILHQLQISCDLSSTHATSILLSTKDEASSGLSTLSRAQKRRVCEDVERVQTTLKDLWEKTIHAVETDLHQLLLHLPLDTEEDRRRDGVWMTTLFEFARTNKSGAVEMAALAAQQRVTDLKLKLERSESERKMLLALDARHRSTTAYVMGTLLKQVATLTRALDEASESIGAPTIAATIPEAAFSSGHPSVFHSFDSQHSGGGTAVAGSAPSPVSIGAVTPAAPFDGSRSVLASSSYNAVCLFDFVEYLEEYAGGEQSRHEDSSRSVPATSKKRSADRSQPVATLLGPERLNELLDRFAATIEEEAAISSPRAAASPTGSSGGGGTKKLLGQIQLLESSVRDATKKVQLSSNKLDADRAAMQLTATQRQQDLKRSREECASLRLEIERQANELEAQKHKFSVFEHQLELQRAQLHAQISERDRHVREAELHVESERNKINKLLERMAAGEFSAEGLDADDMDDNIVQDYLRSGKELKKIQEDFAELTEQHEAVKLDWATSEMTVGKCKDLLRLCCVRLYRAGITPDARVRDMLGEGGSVGISDESLRLIAAAQKQEQDAENCEVLKTSLKPRCNAIKATVKSAFDFQNQCDMDEDIILASAVLLKKSSAPPLQREGSFVSHIGQSEPFSQPQPATSFASFDSMWNDDLSRGGAEARRESILSNSDRRRSSVAAGGTTPPDQQLKATLEPDHEVEELLEAFPRINYVVERLVERHEAQWNRCASLIRLHYMHGQQLRRAVANLISRIPQHKLPDLRSVGITDDDLAAEVRDDLRVSDKSMSLAMCDRTTSTNGMIELEDASMQTAIDSNHFRQVAVQCDIRHVQHPSSAAASVQTDPIAFPEVTSSSLPTAEDEEASSPIIATTTVVQQYMDILTSTSMRFAPGSNMSTLEARRSSLHVGGVPFSAGDDFPAIARSESVSFIIPMPQAPERIICHACGVVIRRGSTVDGGLPLVTRSAFAQANLGDAGPVDTADASTMCEDRDGISTIGSARRHSGAPISQPLSEANHSGVAPARVRSAGSRHAVIVTDDNNMNPPPRVAATAEVAVQTQAGPAEALFGVIPSSSLIDDGAKDVLSELSQTRHFSRTGSARSRISTRSDSESAVFKPIEEDEDVTWMVDDGGGFSEADGSIANPRLTSAMSRRISSLCAIPSVPMPQRHRQQNASQQAVANHPSKLGGALIALPAQQQQGGPAFSRAAGALALPRSTMRISRARAAAAGRATAGVDIEASSLVIVGNRDVQQSQTCSRMMAITSSNARGELRGQSPPPPMFHHRFPSHTPVSIPQQTRPQSSPDQLVIPVAYIHDAFVDTFGCSPSVMLHNKRNIADLATSASRVNSASTNRVANSSLNQPPRASSASVVKRHV